MNKYKITDKKDKSTRIPYVFNAQILQFLCT